jgi:hypothetical protein
LEIKRSLTDEQEEQRLVNIGDWELRHVRQGEQPLVNWDVQGCLRAAQEISLQANVVPLPQQVGAGTEGLPSTGVVAIDNPVAELKCLKEQAAKLRQKKKELADQLRNAQRKHKRLKEKAKQRSDNHLLSVMLLRHEKKARLETAAEAAAAANGTSNASQTAKQSGPQSGPTEEFNREQQTAS